MTIDTWLQNAIADHDNFISCKDSSCGTECAGTDAGTMCGTGLFQSLACDTCVSTSCCSENRACSNNPDCVALLQCTVPCAADQACIMDCQTLHPNGDTDYRALGQCVQTSCSARCP